MLTYAADTGVLVTQPHLIQGLRLGRAKGVPSLLLSLLALLVHKYKY